MVRATCIVRRHSAVTLNVTSLLLALALASASPVASTATCPSPDVALSNLRIKTIAERDRPDHIIITGTVSNVGRRDQASSVKQYVILLRSHISVGKQRVFALPAGGTIDIAFTINRAHEQRAVPLPLGLQLLPGEARRSDCSHANDLIEKTF